MYLVTYPHNLISGAYLEPSQTSAMELFAKIVT